MGMVFGVLAAIIFLARQSTETDISVILATSLMAAGLTAGITGEYLLRLIRKHPNIDQQTF